MSATNKRLRAERQAALLAEREQAARRKQRLTVVGVVLAIVLVVAAGFVVNRLRTDEVGTAIDTAGEYGVTIGDEGATHQVVIYEDFLCPFCGQLESQTRDDLADLAADGTVQVTYRPFVLLSAISDYSERSTAAFGVVLDKAGPEVAKKFHDLLFENQPKESGPFPDDDEIVALAVEAGADEDEVGDAIRDLSGKAFAKEATEEAEQANVSSTPTILLDGEQFQDYTSADEIGPNLLEALTGSAE